MDAPTTLLYIATVLPLICTPGPDMLFVASQSVANGAPAGLRATAGICLGYVVHSTLAALGVAAIVTVFPPMFEMLRWLGVAYLASLAFSLLRSAARNATPRLPAGPSGQQLGRGFITALLNPKGILIYFSVLPQFLNDAGSATFQASILSAIFVALCALVYTGLSVTIGHIGKSEVFNDGRHRWIDGIAGTMLLFAAAWLAVN